MARRPSSIAHPSAKVVVYDGEPLTRTELAARLGLSVSGLAHRVERYGSIEAAIARGAKREPAPLAARYGRLAVLGPAPEQPDGRPRVLCRCDCGTECAMLRGDLLYAGVRTCGCRRHEPTHLIQPGQRYGYLRVVGPEGDRATTNDRWICRCGCGRTVAVWGHNLRSHASRSCGCRKWVRVAALRRKASWWLRRGAAEARGGEA